MSRLPAPGPVPLRPLIAVLAAVVVADLVGLGVLGGSGRAATGGGGGTTATTAAPLPAGQSVVDGTLTALDAKGATGPQLPTPLLITIPNRGRGGAAVYHATVNGGATTIVWQGGQPLGITGHGALVVGRGTVHVDAGGSTWSLDGAERVLAPGSYSINTTVAVGTGGLANPVDSVAFTAGPDTVMVTEGDASIHRDPGPLHLTGPGSLTLTGTLTVRRGTGTVKAATVTFGPGPFVLDLTPGAGGVLTVHAVLNGPVVSR